MVRKSFLRSQLINISYTENQELMRLYEFFISECAINLLFDDNGYLDENDEYWIEGNDIDFSISLRFNKEFLSEFTEAVQELFTPKTNNNKKL